MKLLYPIGKIIKYYFTSLGVTHKNVPLKFSRYLIWPMNVEDYTSECCWWQWWWWCSPVSLSTRVADVTCCSSLYLSRWHGANQLLTLLLVTYLLLVMRKDLGISVSAVSIIHTQHTATRKMDYTKRNRPHVKVVNCCVFKPTYLRNSWHFGFAIASCYILILNFDFIFISKLLNREFMSLRYLCRSTTPTVCHSTKIWCKITSYWICVFINTEATLMSLLLSYARTCNNRRVSTPAEVNDT